MKRIIILSSILFFLAMPVFAEDAFPLPTPRDYVTLPSGSSAPKASPLTLENPIGINNLEDLANKIGGVLVDLAIPVAVVIIIWAGVQFLLAGGTAEKVTKAKKTLWWAIIGLAVIFIGKGFITLIKDILSLKDK